MFLVGTLWFGVASIGCGLATSALMLVVLRFLQGAAGALLQPQVLALLGLSFPGEQRAKAFAAYAMAMGIAGVSGQLLGGALIEFDLLGASWRSCFLINGPVTLIVLAAGPLLLRPDAAQTRTFRLDLTGALVSAAALTCLVTPLTYGREALPLASNLTLGLAGCVLVGVFVSQQRQRGVRGGPVMIPARVALAPGFALGATAVLVFSSGLASFYFVLAHHLQAGLGYGPLRSGAVFGVLGLGFFVASLLGPRLQRRLGVSLAEYGALTVLVGHSLQVLVTAAGLGLPAMALALLCEGAGIGLVMAPLVSLVLARVPSAHASVAAGLVSTMQSTGNAIGVATVATLYLIGVPGVGMGHAARFSSGLISLALVALVLWGILRRLRASSGRRPDAPSP